MRATREVGRFRVLRTDDPTIYSELPKERAARLRRRHRRWNAEIRLVPAYRGNHETVGMSEVTQRRLDRARRAFASARSSAAA
jgi:hypothetical protein